MFKKCDCVNEYQSYKYGKDLRVANPLPKQQGRPQYVRCTVCGKEGEAVKDNLGNVIL